MGPSADILKANQQQQHRAGHQPGASPKGIEGEGA
jgi:hypothetical protein